MSELLHIATRWRKFVGDRRQAERLPVHREVRLICSASPSDEEPGLAVEAGPLPVLVGRTTDTSERGLALSLPSIRFGDRQVIDEGCALRLVLALPTRTVTMQATVVRCEPDDEGYLAHRHRVAVKITGMSDEERAHYQTYLRRLG